MCLKSGGLFVSFRADQRGRSRLPVDATPRGWHCTEGIAAGAAIPVIQTRQPAFTGARSSLRRILPTLLLGSSLRNSTSFGRL